MTGSKRPFPPDSIERAVSDFLADQPETAPDRVIEAAVEQTRDLRQHRSLTDRIWRVITMNSSTRLAATGAAVIVLALAGVGATTLAGAAGHTPPPSGGTGGLLPEQVICSNFGQPPTLGGTAVNLTGTYRAAEGDLFYIRQDGTCVYILGMSPADATNKAGALGTNVTVGALRQDPSAGLVIEGLWSDVPYGQISGVGTIQWQVTRSSAGIHLHNTNRTYDITGTWSTPDLDQIGS